MLKTVLIADDDRALVHGLEQIIRKAGYHTVVAYDGAEALQKARDEHVDLIVLDIHMPKVHGYDFLFDLRKIDGTEQMPILVLTSNQDMGDIFKAEGVKEYIIKPCSPQIVLEKIRKYVQL